MVNPIQIQRLDPNLLGRDFVVGDLHGQLPLLHRLLDEVHFDPHRDRLLSVGDLTDRGSDSPGCLRLLEQPWFYAVQGNHEQMLLDYLRNPGPMQPLLHNGGGWIEGWLASAQSEQRDALIDRLSGLPHLLVVGDGDKRFHLVHAELCRSMRGPAVFSDQDIDRGFPGFDSVEVSRRMLWGRTLAHAQAFHPLPPQDKELSPTYCGHTVAHQVRRYLSHCCIDTGAFAADEGAEFGLSMVEPESGLTYFAS